jgi:hypothetical protein
MIKMLKSKKSQAIFIVVSTIVILTILEKCGVDFQISTWLNLFS